MTTRGEDGGPQRRRLGILLAYHPPREEEGGSRREKWGAGLSQLGFGLGKILTSDRSSGASSIEGIGNSPHVVQEVAEEGAAAGLLRPGDEVVALDGKNVASMDYKAVRQLLAEVCGRKEHMSVTVIRRQQGDNWGATSMTLNFNVPLTLQGPAPTLVDEQLVHSSPSLPPSRPPSIPQPRKGAGMQGIDGKGDGDVNGNGVLVGTDTGIGGLGSSGVPHTDNYSTQLQSDFELIPATPTSVPGGGNAAHVGNAAHTLTARGTDGFQACPPPRVSVKADWVNFEGKSRREFSKVLSLSLSLSL